MFAIEHCSVVFHSIMRQRLSCAQQNYARYNTKFWRENPQGYKNHGTKSRNNSLSDYELNFGHQSSTLNMLRVLCKEESKTSSNNYV